TVITNRSPLARKPERGCSDQLSEGRVLLGAGVGWAEAEFQALGVSFAERGRSTDEALRVMQTVWTQDAPQYSGPYGSFADIIFQPKPVQQPLPIWVGGQSRAALRRTAQFATGWHPIGQSPTQLQ